MVTLFDALAAFVAVLGATIGFLFGHELGGVWGGLAGLIGGGLVGWGVGWLPYVLAVGSIRASMWLSSTTRLRARLARDPFLSHLLIAQLLRRGEPPESFRDIVLNQLRSHNPLVQEFGRRNAAWLFPDMTATEPTKHSRPDVPQTDTPPDSPRF